MPSSGAGRPTLGPILALAGGALLALGSFLPWAGLTVQGFGSASARGTDDSHGWITLGAGAVLVTCALAWMAGRWVRQLGILAIVASLLGGGVGVYDALTAETRIINEVASRFAQVLGAPVPAVRLALHAATRSGQVSVSIQLGVLAVIAGGLAGLIAGMIALMAGRPVSAVQPAGTASPYGWSPTGSTFANPPESPAGLPGKADPPNA